MPPRFWTSQANEALKRSGQNVQDARSLLSGYLEVDLAINIQGKAMESRHAKANGNDSGATVPARYQATEDKRAASPEPV